MTKVLLVEDDPLVRHALKIVIEIDGCDVLEAPDGVEALSIIDSAAVDVVVTDVFMPEMEGIELIRRLSSEHADIPIIAISGGGSVDGHDYLEVAEALGAAAVFEKPLNEEDLIAKIRELQVARAH